MEKQRSAASTGNEGTAVYSWCVGVVCAVMTIASLVLMRENALFWLVLTALSFTIVFAYKAIVEYVIEKAGNGKE